MTEFNEEELFEQLAQQEEHTLEEHEFIHPDVEVLEDDAFTMASAFTVTGVSFKDVRNALAKRGTYRRRTLASIKKVVVHHSGTVTGSAEAYARYHTGSLKWPGIGYHIVIEQDGTVKLCNDLESISYHSGNANSYSVGVSMTGDFSQNEPTDKQWASLYKTLAELQNYLPNIKAPTDFLGHQECPGYASKRCPSLDMDALRYEIKEKTYREVANRFNNDQSVVVINRGKGAIKEPTTPVSTPVSKPTTSTNYNIETGRIGTVTVTVDELNVRESDNLNSKVVSVVKKGSSWKCYGTGKWGYNIGIGFASKSDKYTAFSDHIAIAEILVDSLNVRSDASFTSAVVKENGKDKVLTKGTRWRVYEQKNGLIRVAKNQWISAGEKYVRLTSL